MTLVLFFFFQTAATFKKPGFPVYTIFILSILWIKDFGIYAFSFCHEFNIPWSIMKNSTWIMKQPVFEKNLRKMHKKKKCIKSDVEASNDECRIVSKQVDVSKHSLCVRNTRLWRNFYKKWLWCFFKAILSANLDHQRGKNSFCCMWKSALYETK